MIILMAGLPGTGKSTLARVSAAQSEGVVLDKDEIRSVLFAPRFVEYSAEQDDFCQSVMFETVGYLLGRHPELRIFIDGRTFSRAYQFQNALAAARRLSTPVRVIECICAEETARERLEAAQDTHLAKNRTYELYRRLKAEFEPIPEPKLVIDTDAGLEECAAVAGAYVRGSWAR